MVFLLHPPITVYRSGSIPKIDNLRIWSLPRQSPNSKEIRPAVASRYLIFWIAISRYCDEFFDTYTEIGLDSVPIELFVRFKVLLNLNESC